MCVFGKEAGINEARHIKFSETIFVLRRFIKLCLIDVKVLLNSFENILKSIDETLFIHLTTK